MQISNYNQKFKSSNTFIQYSPISDLPYSIRDLSFSIKDFTKRKPLEDYILEFQAKVKNSIEYNISETKKFKNYDLEGTFTDNLANYGAWDSMVITQIENGKIVTMDFSTMWEYQNSNKVYFRGRP